MKTFEEVDPAELLEVSHLLVQYATQKKALHQLSDRNEKAMEQNNLVDVFSIEEKMNKLEGRVKDYQQKIAAKTHNNHFTL